MAVNLYNEGQSVQSDPLIKSAINTLSTIYKNYSEPKSVQITCTNGGIDGGAEQDRDAVTSVPQKD